MDHSRFSRQLSRSVAGGCSEGSLRLHSWHSLCALLTFLSFTSRLPERLAPGSFDFIGEIPGNGGNEPGNGRNEPGNAGNEPWECWE